MEVIKEAIKFLSNKGMKRLCLTADLTTRAYWDSVLEELKKYDEDVYWACVPQCIRCGDSFASFYEKINEFFAIKK